MVQYAYGDAIVRAIELWALFDYGQYHWCWCQSRWQTAGIARNDECTDWHWPTRTRRLHIL